MSTEQEQPEALRHIQAELGQALKGLGLADDGSGDRGQQAARPAPTQASPDPLPPGTEINRFCVLRRIGRGGQGDVYAAYDPQLDRRVALKVIRVTPGDDVQNTRLMREAQALARLDHPNVIRVHETGIHGAAAFLVMEFKTSHSLTHWLAEDRRRWRDILAKFLAAGRGLRAAHEKGIVHRDVKADNIFVDDHVGAVLGDFGLAFELDDDSFDRSSPTISESHPGSRRPSALLQPLTEKGQFPGTEGYIAPEAMSGRATTLSDQYSFCVALFHALFGVLARPDEQRFPPRPGDNPPLAVVKALHRGLAREPAARFPDMSALLAALDARPRRMALIAGAGLAVAVAVAGAVWAQSSDPCITDARAQAESIWNPKRRAILIRAFAGLALPFADQTGQSLLEWADGYKAQWIEARLSTCVAPSPAVETCLSRQLERFDRLLHTYEAPDPQIALHALDAAASLDVPPECSAPMPSSRTEIPDDLRRDLDQADLRIASGDYDNAHREVAELQRRVPDGPAHPRVLYLAGWLAGATAPDGRSDTLLRNAMHEAARIHDYDTFARAATYRLKSMVLDLGKPAEAIQIELRWIETLAAQWPPGTVADRHFRAEQAEAFGLHLTAEGDYAAAVEQHSLAFDLRDKLVGVRHPLTAKSHHNLADTLAHASDTYDAARDHYIAAMHIRAEQLGESHPETAKTLFALAQAECDYFASIAQRDPGILSDCVDDLEVALADYQSNPALDPRGLTRRFTTLANHAGAMGRHDLATAALDDASTLLKELPDVDPREHSDLFAVRGALEDSRGALAEAHAAYIASLDLLETKGHLDEAYVERLHNAAFIAIDMDLDEAAVDDVLARRTRIADASCPVRLAYANLLDKITINLALLRRAEELQKAASSARHGCI